jgi:hypothetical protein
VLFQGPCSAPDGLARMMDGLADRFRMSIGVDFWRRLRLPFRLRSGSLRPRVAAEMSPNAVRVIGATALVRKVLPICFNCGAVFENQDRASSLVAIDVAKAVSRKRRPDRSLISRAVWSIRLGLPDVGLQARRQL